MSKKRENQILNSHGEEHPRRLKMLHLQLIAFNLSGILPPANTSGSRCKTMMYHVFTALSLVWFLPAITLQLIALCQRLDDIEVATAILFQVSCYLSTGIIFFYFVWNRTELIKLFDTLEAGFIGHMDKIGSPTRRNAILEEATRKSAVITRALFGLCFTVEIAWGCIPCILGYLEYLTDDEPRDLTNDRGRYFGLTMWLPENVNESPTYELMHVFHVIAVYTVVSNITGCYMLMFAFAFHTTTQFKILCAAFEDVDLFVQRLHNSGRGRRRNTMEQSTDADLSTEDGNYNYVSGSENAEMPHDGNFQGHISGSLGPQYSVVPGRRDKAFDLRYPNDFNITKSPRWNTEENPETSDIEKCEYSLLQYLIECIQFHQALIKFSNDMNKFLSPVILIFFVFSEAMMCLSTFQLALGQADERSFKFFTSVILAFIWPLVVCTYGDELMQQSAAVSRAAFGCQWYDRSLSFNRLLRTVIMRAQKPVILTAGRFYVVSLATFADIGNKVYAYFTLLKRMNEK